MEGLPAQQQGEDRVVTECEWRCYNTFVYSVCLTCLGLSVLGGVAYAREKYGGELLAAILMGLAALIILGLHVRCVLWYLYFPPSPEENLPGRRRDATRPVV